MDRLNKGVLSSSVCYILCLTCGLRLFLYKFVCGLNVLDFLVSIDQVIPSIIVVLLKDFLIVLDICRILLVFLY